MSGRATSSGSVGSLGSASSDVQFEFVNMPLYLTAQKNLKEQQQQQNEHNGKISGAVVAQPSTGGGNGAGGTTPKPGPALKQNSNASQNGTMLLQPGASGGGNGSNPPFPSQVSMVRRVSFFGDADNHSNNGGGETPRNGAGSGLDDWNDLETTIPLMSIRSTASSAASTTNTTVNGNVMIQPQIGPGMMTGGKSRLLDSVAIAAAASASSSTLAMSPTSKGKKWFQQQQKSGLSLPAIVKVKGSGTKGSDQNLLSTIHSARSIQNSTRLSTDRGSNGSRYFTARSYNSNAANNNNDSDSSGSDGDDNNRGGRRGLYNRKKRKMRRKKRKLKKKLAASIYDNGNDEDADGEEEEEEDTAHRRRPSALTRRLNAPLVTLPNLHAPRAHQLQHVITSTVKSLLTQRVVTDNDFMRWSKIYHIHQQQLIQQQQQKLQPVAEDEDGSKSARKGDNAAGNNNNGNNNTNNTNNTSNPLSESPAPPNGSATPDPDRLTPKTPKRYGGGSSASPANLNNSYTSPQFRRPSPSRTGGAISAEPTPHPTSVTPGPSSAGKYVGHHGSSSKSSKVNDLNMVAQPEMRGDLKEHSKKLFFELGRIQQQEMIQQQKKPSKKQSKTPVPPEGGGGQALPSMLRRHMSKISLISTFGGGGGGTKATDASG